MKRTFYAQKPLNTGPIDGAKPFKCKAGDVVAVIETEAPLDRLLAGIQTGLISEVKVEAPAKPEAKPGQSDEPERRLDAAPIAKPVVK